VEARAFFPDSVRCPRVSSLAPVTRMNTHDGKL
jgi:hypothetical protein